MAAQSLQLLMLQIRKIVDGKSGASYDTLHSSKGRSQHISYSYMSMIFALNNKGCPQLLRSWGGGLSFYIEFVARNESQIHICKLGLIFTLLIT